MNNIPFNILNELHIILVNLPDIPLPCEEEGWFKCNDYYFKGVKTKIFNKNLLSVKEEEKSFVNQTLILHKIHLDKFISQLSGLSLESNLDSFYRSKIEKKNKKLIGISPIIIFEGINRSTLEASLNSVGLSLTGGSITRRNKINLCEYRLSNFLNLIGYYENKDMFYIDYTERKFKFKNWHNLQPAVNLMTRTFDDELLNSIKRYNKFIRAYEFYLYNTKFIVDILAKCTINHIKEIQFKLNDMKTLYKNIEEKIKETKDSFKEGTYFKELSLLLTLSRKGAQAIERDNASSLVNKAGSTINSLATRDKEKEFSKIESEEIIPYVDKKLNSYITKKDKYLINIDKCKSDLKALNAELTKRFLLGKSINLQLNKINSKFKVK